MRSLKKILLCTVVVGTSLTASTSYTMAENSQKDTQGSITHQAYGKTPSGTAVEEWVLRNRHGIEIHFYFL